ncbi:MAG TPA: alkaline phosphatase family protein [Reyranella sp.]|nr:alkaline phosphatase family protein [Reyranella sp.]
MRPFSVLAAVTAAGLLALPAVAQTPAPAPGRPHNVILFVADGLRGGMVNEKNAPAMAALMARGVHYTNSHSLFPTFTTANASGMATGHHLGDTGDFSNNIYVGFPMTTAGGSVTPFLENDAVLGEVDKHFGGSYLNEETMLQAARDAGYSTAAVGKVGPVLIFDSTERTGQHTIVVDDQTGRPGGIPLSDEMGKRLAAAQLPTEAPGRGENGKSGNSTTPGTTVANIGQQGYFTGVTTKVLLPMFKERNKPFLMVYWSRDPDGSQHNQGDSLGRLVPGINGPTSLAAIRNADDNLASILAALKEQGLEGTTDVVVTSDHGFSTISKESATSFAASQTYKGVVPGQLPAGFVALDVAHALGLKMYDPDNKNGEIAAGSFPVRGNGLLGDDPAKPQVVVVSNGGSDLIYVPGGDKALTTKIVSILAAQDYVSGLFVDDAIGKIPGTLPLSAIALKGASVTPHPTIAVNFRSFTTGCADPTTCGVEVADTPLQQGQGMHGSFSRADTRNFMAAAGPGFRQHFEDVAPASNADLNRTIVRLMGLKVPDKGKLVGRVLTESLPNGPMPFLQKIVVRSEPDSAGRKTVVVTETADGVRYFNVGGYPGRTLGLPAHMGD